MEPLRAAAAVHKHHGGAGRSGAGGHAGVEAQPADIVDQRGAGSNGSTSDFGLVGIHRDRDGQALGQLFNDRDDPPDLVVGGD